MRQVRPPSPDEELGDEAIRHLGVRKVAAYDDGPTAHGADLPGDILGVVDRGIAVHRHVPAVGSEIERQLAADPARRPGDEDGLHDFGIRIT